jgi:hypothetical protein
MDYDENFDILMKKKSVHMTDNVKIANQYGHWSETQIEYVCIHAGETMNEYFIKKSVF